MFVSPYAAFKIVFILITNLIKLMKGKALRNHSLHEKTAASVLLKPFISSNEWGSLIADRM